MYCLIHISGVVIFIRASLINVVEKKSKLVLTGVSKVNHTLLLVQSFAVV